MAPKMIFLVGAPLPGNLDWDHDELLNAPVPPFHNADTNSRTEHQAYLNQDSIKWRVLQPLSTDTVDDHYAFYWGPKDPNFLTSHQLINADSVTNDGNDTTLSQFYDHSFAIHEASEISGSESQENLTQELDSIEAADSPSKELLLSPPFRMNGPLRDLKDIPTARDLQTIVPQTISVNLVVGVIAVHPPRRVITRQWKKELDIIELVVGDETRAGFGVNFWLPVSVSADQTAAKAEKTYGLGRSLARLRPQDIVLLRTVGLSSFRDQVYGQSLRGGMTQVDLLHRSSTDAGELDKVPTNVQGDLPQKVRKVREWILRFVGTDGVGGTSPGMPETQRGRLPPDTQ
ncbi:uncharacterized protein N7503_002358 [Penicillium pulvis]|uniref:uncharacterized protein n=1 Tax=Penicillium pulvis TaxID=1562058 RepID=UPI002547BB70|nr:uncharacterized protein N7503_002358 [Penicillium pulvis]KAJ5810140.1 hypothetical protein N7503_002358 [Penicillium pulvis]